MEDEKLVYEVPQVITYAEEEILIELGPAHAGNGCDPYNGCDQP